MTSAEWADLMVLFVLRLAELWVLCYFLSPLEKRNHTIWVNALQIVGFAVLLTMVHKVIYQVNWESEFVYINFAYYPTLFVLIMVRYMISVKEGIYFLLLFFLCAHPLRPLIMQFSASVYGVNYLVEGSYPFFSMLFLTLFLSLLLFEIALLKIYAFRYPRYKLTWLQLGLTIIATIPVVYVTNLFLILNTDYTTLPISLMVIGVVCGFCGMINLIGYKNTLAFEKNKQEMAALETLLASQQKQYQLKKETIEIINAKYHDLKKHIHYLVSIDSPKEREKYLENLKLQISAYEAFHETGNETLDIVLTDKDMDCRKNDIQLLLFVDGKPLEFLQPLDLVTIFGNAIDNSLEAVMNLPKSSRTITVRMREYDTWLVITFENQFTGELRWKGSQLLSTKGKEGERGFGLMNIWAAVEKYGGNVTVDGKDSQFILTLLFPRA